MTMLRQFKQQRLGVGDERDLLIEHVTKITTFRSRATDFRDSRNLVPPAVPGRMIATPFM